MPFQLASSCFDLFLRVYLQDSTDTGAMDKPSEITISDDILEKAPVGLNNPDLHRREKAIGFLQALRIPVLI